MFAGVGRVAHGETDDFVALLGQNLQSPRRNVYFGYEDTPYFRAVVSYAAQNVGSQPFGVQKFNAGQVLAAAIQHFFQYLQIHFLH